jgi:ferritin
MVLDKVKLIGNDKGGMYLLDRDLETSAITGAENNMPPVK